MKKLLLITLTILFGNLMLKAANPLPISVGLKVGYTYAEIETLKALSLLNVSNVISSDGSNGSVFGAYVRFGSKKLYFQPELIYVTQNSTFSSILVEAAAATGITKKGKLKRTTLDVPLQLGYKILNLPLFKLRVFAGPCASIQVNNRFEFEKNIESLEAMAKDDFKSLNWTVRGGIGIDASKFILDISYQYGLNDVAENYFKKPKTVIVTLGYKIF